MKVLKLCVALIVIFWASPVFAQVDQGFLQFEPGTYELCADHTLSQCSENKKRAADNYMHFAPNGEGVRIFALTDVPTLQSVKFKWKNQGKALMITWGEASTRGQGNITIYNNGIIGEAFNGEEKFYIKSPNIDFVPGFGVVSKKSIRKEYYANGKLKIETPYKLLEKDGTGKEYYENGKLKMEIPYKENKIEGIVKTYHENGKIKYESPHRADQSEGITKQYYESGKLMVEMPVKAGKKEGIEKFYYESGKLKQENKFKAGKREGITKSYDEYGRLAQESTYKDDILEGALKLYRKNGKMFVTITYEENLPVSGLCHHIDGRASNLTNAELINWQNGLGIECN